MHGAHMHLVLNHVPVVLMPAALVALALGLWRRNPEFVKISLGLVVAAALATAPAFFTGEPAADAIGGLGLDIDERVELHEEAAMQSFLVTDLAGIAALASLVMLARRRHAPRWLLASTVVLTLLASVSLGFTAHLGGQIRHTEMR